MTSCAASADRELPGQQADSPVQVGPTKQPSVGGGQTLTVFAAASLTEAFTELGRLFESQNPGAQVIFNFGGSQQLAQQLAQGAPADVFASADQVQMDAALQSGRISTSTVRPLAGNKLVLIFASSNPGELNQIKDLARPGLKLVLADPKVPIGRYCQEVLDKAALDPELGAGYKDEVLKNVVSYEDSVRAVLTKVSLGEADAGIVYTSDIITRTARQVGTLEIPDALNVNALYFISDVQDSSRPALAQRFIELALSQVGQELLARYGFLMVQ